MRFFSLRDLLNHTTMKTLLIICALMIVSVAFAFSQTSDYQVTLKKMFEVSGSQGAYKSAIMQMFTMFKQNANVPQEVWNDMEKEFLATSMDELVKMLTPVYEKHLTKADLQKLIDFYQTPVGVKFAEKTPLIMQESMQVGQEWGMKIGQQFQEKLKAKGY
jgi:uncharacterized protein